MPFATDTTKDVDTNSTTDLFAGRDGSAGVTPAAPQPAPSPDISTMAPGQGAGDTRADLFADQY
jgi:hypothetical protein